jgi:hypothetical protein
MGRVYGGKPVFGGGIAPVSHPAAVNDGHSAVHALGNVEGGRQRRLEGIPPWTARDGRGMKSVERSLARIMRDLATASCAICGLILPQLRVDDSDLDGIFD